MLVIVLHTQEEQVSLLSSWLAESVDGMEVASLPVTASVAVSTDDVFFVPEPLLFLGGYFFVTDLWEKFFAYKYPMVKVVGFGYHPEEDQNYLNLLELPSKPEAFLSRAMQADRNIIFRKGKGTSIRFLIRKFFEGHGDQSVTDELDKVLRIMQIAHDELKNHGEDYALIQLELFVPNALPQKWKLIQNRWSFYGSYFKSTPFYGEIEQLWQLLQKLSPFFDGNFEKETLFWVLD